MTIDEAAQKKLREKFDQAAIGLKPKVTCPDCSKKRCNREDHKPQRCTGLNGDAGCKQWITPRHIHVEFVGHADVTDRLLQVDPEWDWEPLAYAEDGLPRFTADGGLWIKLTILGKTRIGYGGSDGKTGDDGVKEAISDALKVTAMRFGVALDLWRKSETSGKAAEEETPAAGRGAAAQRQAVSTGGVGGGQRNGQQQSSAQQGQRPDPVEKAKAHLRELIAARKLDGNEVAARYEQQYGETLKQATDATRVQAFTKLVEGEPAGASS